MPVRKTPAALFGAVGGACRRCGSGTRRSSSVSRAVCTLSTASRAFSRAIKLADERSTGALSPRMKTPARLSRPVARIAIAIIDFDQREAGIARPVRVVCFSSLAAPALPTRPRRAVPAPRLDQRGRAHDGHGARAVYLAGNRQVIVPFTTSPLASTSVPSLVKPQPASTRTPSPSPASRPSKVVRAYCRDVRVEPDLHPVLELDGPEDGRSGHLPDELMSSRSVWKAVRPTKSSRTLRRWLMATSRADRIASSACSSPESGLRQRQQSRRHHHGHGGDAPPEPDDNQQLEEA